MNLEVEFTIVKLKGKLNFASKKVEAIDKMIKDTDLSKKENVNRIREFCSDLSMFLKEV